MCGPGRNAYETLSVLQKPSTQQGNSYRIEPYKTSCRGHMFLAFVDEMVSPIVSLYQITFTIKYPKSWWIHPQPSQRGLPSQEPSLHATQCGHQLRHGVSGGPLWALHLWLDWWFGVGMSQLFWDLVYLGLSWFILVSRHQIIKHH